MIDLQKYQEELAKRKDAFWARKVIHLAGIKAFIQVSIDPRKDMLSAIVSRDIVSDLEDHYGKKNLLERSCEMTQDVEEMLTVLLEEAGRQLQTEAEAQQH